MWCNFNTDTDSIFDITCNGPDSFLIYFFFPKKVCNKIDRIIMNPPIKTVTGEISFINNHAHKGPKTDHLTLKFQPLLKELFVNR